MSNKPLFIPVILGTTRKGRASENVANFVFEEVKKRKEVETVLIDLCDLNFKTDDAGEALKDPGFSTTVARADGLVLVVPEYNHGYPGLLKHALDTNLKEYIHKAVGVCGVSAGIFGGTRMIQNLLPVLRELGLVTIFWDGNFARAQELFDAQGKILDQSYGKRIDQFLNELIWMSTVLRYGRENVSQWYRRTRDEDHFTKCGSTANRDAERRARQYSHLQRSDLRKNFAKNT
jgi:NAD(P)H-dependent FMN reductase